jgi:hypothetical protein
MKRRPSGAKVRNRAFRVWTLAQTEAATPYIASVVASLREHTVEARRQRRTLAVLNERTGRPDRSTLIAMQDADRAARRAEEQTRETEQELNDLDVLSLDAVNGLALVPFVHDEQLAWYVFDLYDTPSLRFWRFQTDPTETRRPITAAQHGIPDAALTT